MPTEIMFAETMFEELTERFTKRVKELADEYEAAFKRTGRFLEQSDDGHPAFWMNHFLEAEYRNGPAAFLTAAAAYSKRKCLDLAQQHMRKWLYEIHWDVDHWDDWALMDEQIEDYVSFLAAFCVSDELNERGLDGDQFLEETGLMDLERMARQRRCEWYFDCDDDDEEDEVEVEVEGEEIAVAE